MHVTIPEDHKVMIEVPAEVRTGDAEVIVLSSASVGAPQPADTVDRQTGESASPWSCSDWAADPNDPNKFGPPNISIFPNADGVINMDQHDYDDQAKIAKNLACSLNQSCPP